MKLKTTISLILITLGMLSLQSLSAQKVKDAENAKQVIEMGKTPIVWEGFHKTTNSMIPKEVKVMVWDSSFQLASALIADGFEVINCSWLPTYVVTPLWVYSEKDCYNWDIRSFGTINDASPYHNGAMRMPESKNLIGGQLNSWGDFVENTDYYANGALGARRRGY